MYRALGGASPVRICGSVRPADAVEAAAQWRGGEGGGTLDSSVRPAVRSAASQHRPRPVPAACTGCLYRLPVPAACIGFLYRLSVSASCIGAGTRRPLSSRVCPYIRSASRGNIHWSTFSTAAGRAYPAPPRACGVHGGGGGGASSPRRFCLHQERNPSLSSRRWWK